ncbi:MAG TPA: TonB-dependent receptor [Sphingomonas sp.]
MRHALLQAVGRPALVSAGLFGLLQASPALAEDAAAAPASPKSDQQGAAPVEGLEVITVTARKQTENLEKTPISITAFTAARLEAQGITAINRIQDFTPNLTFANIPANSGIASNAAVYIRGIGQNDFAPTVDPGVGIYVDGVYLGRSAGAVFDLIDVDSVEVLRGPQGTLFGRNTIGGAINVTSIQPSDKFIAKGDIKYGTDNRINVRGVVSGPLADGIYAKIAGGIFSQDGYVDAPNLGKKLGNQDTKMVRGAIRVAPAGSPVEVTIAGDWSRDKSNGAPVVIKGIDMSDTGSFVFLNDALALGNPALCFNAANAGNTACYNNRVVSKDTNYATGKTYSDLEIWSLSGTAKWHVSDAVELKSITAYRHVSGSFAQDRDGSNLPINYVSDDFLQKQWSEELQLTGKALDKRLSWVAGFYYYHESGFDLNPVNFLVGGAESGGYYNYNDWAVYGQGTYKITDKLSLTAGLRYTQDRKKFLPDQYVTANFPPFFSDPIGTPVVPHETVKANANRATPMVNLAYQWTPGFMVYATYSQGFKGGGYTQRIFPPEASLPSFKPESVDSYEAGFKWVGFDNHLRLNADGYYTSYSDMQLLVADASRVGPFITNAGRARITGFEAEATLIPAEGWRLAASAGLTDARYTRLDNGVEGLTLDSRFVLIPKWTLSGSIEKDIDLGGAGMIVPRVDWSYRSGVYTNANGVDTPALYQPAYSLFNASVRWHDARSHYNFTAGVDNIGNKKYMTYGDDSPSFGYYIASYDRGRQWYVKAGFSF